MNLPYFGLNVRLLFTDLFRIWIRNIYFGSGSDPDPAKSFGSFRIRFRFRIRIRNTVKNTNSSPPPKHGKMPIRVTALAFDLCVLYYRSPCTLHFPLH